MNVFQEVKTNWRKWQPIDDEQLEAFATAAYKQAEEWFGAPPDAKWCYEIFQGHHGACSRIRLFRTYLLSFDSKQTEYPARCGTIAHEMYHRFTMQKTGLHKQVWIDEMLAYQTESMMLAELGQSNYADRLTAWAQKQPKQMDGAALRQVRRKREFLGIGGPVYPEGFGSAVYRFSDALEALVKWEAMRKIVGAQTWETWFATLPPSLVPLVKYILEFPDSEDPVISEDHPQRVTLMRRLALALLRKDCLEEAIPLYEKSLELSPKAPRACYWLGHCYEERGESDRAIDIWLKSLDFDPDQADLHFNLGLLYKRKNEIGAAIKHLEEAARLEPKEARYRNFLEKLSGASVA